MPTPRERVAAFLRRFPFLTDERPEWWEDHGAPELVAMIDAAVADAVALPEIPARRDPPEESTALVIIGEEEKPPHPLAHPKVQKALRVFSVQAGCDYPPPPAIVARATRKRLLDLPGCGPAVLRRIEEWLAGFGLSLREEDA